MKAFSLLRIFVLVFTILAAVGASNPIEERGLRQGETLSFGFGS